MTTNTSSALLALAEHLEGHHSGWDMDKVRQAAKYLRSAATAEPVAWRSLIEEAAGAIESAEDDGAYQFDAEFTPKERRLVSRLRAALASSPASGEPQPVVTGEREAIAGLSVQLDEMIQRTVNPAPTNMSDRRVLDWVNGKARQIKHVLDATLRARHQGPDEAERKLTAEDSRALHGALIDSSKLVEALGPDEAAIRAQALPAAPAPASDGEVGKPAQAITVFKDGGWKVWRATDAAYAHDDSVFVTIPLPAPAGFAEGVEAAASLLEGYTLPMDDDQGNEIEKRALEIRNKRLAIYVAHIRALTPAPVTASGERFCDSAYEIAEEMRQEDRRTASGAQDSPASEGAEPVAFVPQHPRQGLLWTETYPATADVGESRSGRYPVVPLYTHAPTEAKLREALERARPYVQFASGGETQANVLRAIDAALNQGGQ